MIKKAKKPVIYSGGGCLDAADELTQFARATGIPICSTLMGLGAFPESDDLSLRMLGMHGAVYANYAIDNADLMLAFGVRFDDRVTGKLDAFASRASIVHVDIDPAEIGKNKTALFHLFKHQTVVENVEREIEQGDKLTGLLRLAKRSQRTKEVAPVPDAGFAKRRDFSASGYSVVARSDQGRGCDFHRRRPASNVGRAALFVRRTEKLVIEWWFRFHGFWFTRGYWCRRREAG
jgi:thiamine pyrophosphate-dependent acetolactate synthase large subunit-like protein